MTKTCTACLVVKPLEGFHRNCQRKDGRESRCATCRSSRMRAQNAANPALREATHYRSRIKAAYGITPEDVETMRARQRGLCAICEKAVVGRRMSIDHCHATGKVRGLLCSHCNLMLGHSKDNPVVLQRAIAYLAGGV